MSSGISSFGFSCELNDETVKIYTIEHGIVELKNTGDLELGVWYDIWENSLEARDEYENKRCEVWEEDGEVFAKVLAIGPNNFFLPPKIHKKYKYAVWNPFLKYLDDGDNLFKDKVRGDDVVEIVVKYAPWKNGNFKIIELIEEAPFEGSSYCRLTPWTLEFMGLTMKEAAFPRPNNPCVKKDRVPPSDDVQMGLCIKASYRNVAFRQETGGSTEYCSYLFNPVLGLTRWMPKETASVQHENPEANKLSLGQVEDDPLKVEHRIGKWYTYSLNANKKGSRYSAVNKTTAKKVTEFQNPPKVTRVVDGEVEIEASFLFDYDMFEAPENRQTKDGQRFPGLSKDAHFWDHNLGRVEIYPNISMEIIQAVENHREGLDPTESELLMNEAIVVSVTAVVLRNFMRNFENYPNNGIFVAKTLDTICYLNGGKIIYQR
ncbi:hypothetical protein GCK72_019859 [Caenorhabditis remanei]|uniref:Uncharacterized protein n=1 Tax=Caenorhabditis remanei TaxID=31234 RepID=A0A6A5GF63_CAERE|nr:hypothetical protein GCK72_019859 [Caenorhabditis remanei]KAF1753303.1 hypothetical protein GCK72_019859 [Caenorhabditis remanei]